MKRLPLFAALFLFACAPLCAQSPTPAPAAPPPPMPSVAVPAGCQPDDAAPSPADAALFQQDWARAVKLSRDDAAAHPTSIEAQADIIRALLGQEKIDDALKLAQSLAAEHPQSGEAQEILGETFVRSGEFDMAPDPLAAALHLSPCSGRAHYAEGRLLRFSGLEASAARQFAAAHALAPSDLQITAAWIHSLPVGQAVPLMRSFLDSHDYLDTERREDLRSTVTLREAVAAVHTTVTVPKLPAEIKLIPGPEHGPDPGIATVDVTVNGHTRRMALSTESTGLVIPKSLAQALGLKPIVRYSYSQAFRNGRIHYYLAVADSLRIGPVEYKNFPVRVMDEDFGLSRDIEGAEGSLNMGTFDDFLVHLDYTHGQIRLDALPSISATTDSLGQPLWSVVSPGATVPSMNGNVWGDLNRVVNPDMRGWTPFFGVRDDILLLTTFGPGPSRLFTWEMNAGHPLLATSAATDISTLRAMPPPLSSSHYKGYFMGFAGVIAPVESWDVVRFDNSSERNDLEISGLIDQSSLLSVPFSVDYRDHLVHFERAK